MTAQEFQDFLNFMRWSNIVAAEHLGRTKETISAWRNHGVPESAAKTVKLACEALKKGVRA